MESVNSKRKLLALCIIMGVGIICCSQPLMAAFVMQQNEYMYLKMGAGGTCSEEGAERQVSGRWSVGTVLGDPDPKNSDDNDMVLIREGTGGSPCWYLGYTTVRIDQGNHIFGDTGSGSWERAPEVGSTGFRVFGSWISKDTNVGVHLQMEIIRDQVRFEYTIRNDDTEQHSVGIRMVGDAMVETSNRVAYPYVPGFGIHQPEIDLRGAGIPDYFEIYNDPGSPSVIARNILRGQDATTPDRVAIGEWHNMWRNDWLYTPVPDRAVGNHGWAIWWDEMVLQPGQTRTIITYFGMGTATSSWTSGTPARQDPYVVAVSSPRALSPDSAGSIPPFTVSAYIYNLSSEVTLTNVNLNLSLPDCLELTDDADNTASKSVPESISPEMEASAIQWRVKPVGTVAGPVTFMVSVSGSPYVQKTVSRTIVLPATYAKATVPDWQMISVPFELMDQRPEYSLWPMDPSTGQVVSTGLQALCWNADRNDYFEVSAIRPGQAFWLKYDSSSVSQMTLRPPGSTSTNAVVLPGNQSMPIELKSGWNQIGNPFLYPVLWGRVKILNSAQVGPVSIEEAANRNWVRRTVYWYNVGKGEYDYSSSPLTELLPWQGYWIKALTPCQLIIPPVEQIGVPSVPSLQSRMADSVATLEMPVLDGWRLELKARAGDSVSGSAGIGLDSRASDGYGAEDIERPPSLVNYVNVEFVHQDWGQNSGKFVQDVRRSGSDKEWEMEVSTDKVDADIVLTWPGVNSVPKNYRLRLEDTETGVRKDMRTTSSYRYNAGGSSTRRFKVIAESTGRGRLLISGLNVSASRSAGTATVSYSLSTDAVADVKIRSASGSQVATLASGRGATRGISSLVWNYRNEKGESVPAGSYIVEIVATTPEGEVAKALTPFIVAR